MKNRLGFVAASVTLMMMSTTLHAQPALPVVALIATGGTIAMKIDPVKKAPVPAISGEDLLATVPDVAKYAKVEVNNLSNVPSDYMDPPRWVQLTKAVQDTLARPEVAGVIVSHGTDTLEETAWWLDLTVQLRQAGGADRRAAQRLRARLRRPAQPAQRGAHRGRPAGPRARA